MAKKRVKLETEQPCVRCGDVLPAGMTAYALSGDDGVGYLHYGKCRGTMLADSLKSVDLSTMAFSKLLQTIRGELPASETVRTMAMQEIERRETNFRKAIEGALAEIEDDERLGYPTATVVENAPLALIQCALENQRKALKYVLMALDKKEDVE